MCVTSADHAIPESLFGARIPVRGNGWRPAGGHGRSGLFARHDQEHLRHRCGHGAEYRRNGPVETTACSPPLPTGSAASRFVHSAASSLPVRRYSGCARCAEMVVPCQRNRRTGAAGDWHRRRVWSGIHRPRRHAGIPLARGAIVSLTRDWALPTLSGPRWDPCVPPVARPAPKRFAEADRDAALPIALRVDGGMVKQRLAVMRVSGPVTFSDVAWSGARWCRKPRTAGARRYLLAGAEGPAFAAVARQAAGRQWQLERAFIRKPEPQRRDAYRASWLDAVRRRARGR